MSTSNYYITIEEASRRLGRSREAVYAAVRRGRLRPVRRGRRNFFASDEIDAFKHHLENRWASKEEARQFYELFPSVPHNDQGVPVIEPRRWDIFVAYASDPDATYDTVGEQYHITRQRVQQITATVVESLAEIAEVL